MYSAHISFFHKHLYEDMDDGMVVILIQFGLIAKQDPTFHTFPKRCSYISERLDTIQLAQNVVFPCNPGYNIYLLFVHIIC